MDYLNDEENTSTNNAIISELPEERELLESCITDEEETVKSKMKDNYNIAKITFFLAGLLLIAPWYTFITPVDYWMYKFRNTSDQHSTEPLEHKTTLQKYFLSYITNAVNLAALSVSILVIFFGDRIRRGILGTTSLVAVLLIFTFQTAIVHVNTDQYQIIYLFVILTSAGITCVFTSLFQVYILNTISLFPTSYMQTFTYGQSCCAVFITIIQVITLVVDVTPLNSGLCFFLSGLIAIVITCIFYFILKKTDFYHYHTRIAKAEETIDLHHLSQMKFIAKQAAPALICLFGNFLGTISVLPASVLIVPKEKHLTIWTGRLFIPVCFYMVYNFGDLSGRLFCKFLHFDKKCLRLLYTITLIHILLAPLLLLCNLQPRNHLPVLFESEVFFIMINLLIGFTNGFITMFAMSIAPSLVSPQLRSKLGFVLNFAITFSLEIASFLSTFVIRIL